MAYLQDFSDDEDKKESGQVLSSSEPLIGANSPSSSGSAPAPKIATGSGFINFDQYLTKNSEASGKMAGEVVKPLEQNIASRNDAGNRLQQSASAIKPETRNQEWVNSTLSAPSKANKDEVSGVLKGWQGPQSAYDLEGYQDLSKASGSVDSKAKQLQSSDGIETQLQDVYGKSAPYSKGGRVLDTALTGSGEGRKVLDASINKAGQLPSLDSQLSAAESSVDTAKKSANDLAALLSSTAQTKKGQMEDRFNLLQSQKPASFDANQFLMSLGGANPLSFAEQEALKSKQFDLSTLVNAPTAKGLGQLAPQQEQQDYLALAELFGFAPSVMFDQGGSGEASLNQDNVLMAKKLAAEELAANKARSDAERSAKLAAVADKKKKQAVALPAGYGQGMTFSEVSGGDKDRLVPMTFSEESGQYNKEWDKYRG